MFFFHHT